MEIYSNTRKRQLVNCETRPGFDTNCRGLVKLVYLFLLFQAETVQTSWFDDVMQSTVLPSLFSIIIWLADVSLFSMISIFLADYIFFFFEILINCLKKFLVLLHLVFQFKMCVHDYFVAFLLSLKIRRTT